MKKSTRPSREREEQKCQRRVSGGRKMSKEWEEQKCQRRGRKKNVKGEGGT